MAGVATAAPVGAPTLNMIDVCASGDTTEPDDLDEEEQAPERAEEVAWESESFYTDAFEELGDEQYGQSGDDMCTSEESKAYKNLLRTAGIDEFIRQTIESETISAKKLCTAFGMPSLPFMENAPDEAYLPLLGKAIERELHKRQKLEQYNTIEDAVALLQNSKNIVVITGAGISTSLGIPDFRSKHTGLYSQLEHLGLTDPQEVFDIRLFRENPSVFYSVAKDILPSTRKFSPTHAFIKLLQDKRKLLTNYTQNIDNLESFAGIIPEKLIQCHGSFATATCIECRQRVNGDVIHADIKAGKVPQCQACIRRTKRTQLCGVKRKRSSKSKKRNEFDNTSSEDDEQEAASAGVMKPDITFFGEDLPDKFHDRLANYDQDRVDLVIVIGTSLKVAPVSEVPSCLRNTIPQIYISRDPCRHIDFDIELMGDCDVVVAELCKRAGWDLRHDMIPAKQEVHVNLAPETASQWRFKVADAEPSLQSTPTSHGLFLPSQSKLEPQQRLSPTPVKPASVAHPLPPRLPRPLAAPVTHLLPPKLARPVSPTSLGISVKQPRAKQTAQGPGEQPGLKPKRDPKAQQPSNWGLPSPSDFIDDRAVSLSSTEDYFVHVDQVAPEKTPSKRVKVRF